MSQPHSSPEFPPVTESEKAALSQALSSRAWWTVIPEEERAVFLANGMSRPQRMRGRAALIVIDATVDFTGSRPMPVAEAIKEYSSSCGAHAWEALPHIRALLDAFRGAGLPVVYTARDLKAQQAARAATKRTADLPEAVSFVDLVRPREDEWVCGKARASAFFGTSLDAYLRINGIDSLVFCGGSTSGCVRASCVDAFSHGFQVTVAEDGCFDRALTPHLANLFDLHAKYATVRTTNEIVTEVGARRAA